VCTYRQTGERDGSADATPCVFSRFKKEKSPYDRIYVCTPSTFEIGTTQAGCSQGQPCREHAVPTAAMYKARELN